MRSVSAAPAHVLLACVIALGAAPWARADDEGSPTTAPAHGEDAPRSGEPGDAENGEPAGPELDEPEDGEDLSRRPAEDVVATIGSVVGSDDLAGGTTDRPRSRIVWREDWPRYSFDEAVLSLGLGALLLSAELLPTATTSANWRGGILFDQPVRDELRLRSHDARESAKVASEVLQWVLVGFPFLVDALAVTGFGDGNWDAAFQMGLIALEAYVIALVIWKLTVLLARRERPVAGACAEGLDSPHCREEFETTSFFSNQAMNAFTGASLVCLHHTHMPLFGDEVVDASTCVGAITAASVIGLLRVMSDFEYLTDVLMGAVVGFVAGYLAPWIVHYQGGARPELRAPIAAIPLPLIAPHDTYGLTAAGWF